MRLILMLAAFVFALQTGAPAPAEKDKKRGGPGATGEAQKLPQEILKERTFELHVPPDLHLTPGQRRDVVISLESGVTFSQAVRLYFGEPNGLRVLPAHAQIRAGDKQTTVVLIADRDVSTGDKTLRMVGEPEAGQSVLMKVPVHVDDPK
jgi:hypothetical protein